MIEKTLYIHSAYEKQKELLMDIIPAHDELLTYHQEFTGKLKKADRYGKTVQISEKQFPKVYEIVKDLSEIAEIDIPEVFVYEDFYYGAEAKGNIIEISAKTLEDFTLNQLRFLLAREICKIKDKMTDVSKLVDVSEEALANISTFPGRKILARSLRLKYSQWSRAANYSADAYGYLMMPDLKVCITVILALVLNNLTLVRNMDIVEYLGQAKRIYRLDDAVSRYTENDEQVPYGPLRIKYLMSFATSLPVIKYFDRK